MLNAAPRARARQYSHLHFVESGNTRLVRRRRRRQDSPELVQRESQVQTNLFALFSFPDPPNPPRLTGVDVGRPERRKGDRVRLECVSSGGNPLPKIEWRRNGKKLSPGKNGLLLLLWQTFSCNALFSR